MRLATSWRLSFRIRFVRWLSTVLTLMPSFAAISLVLWLSATSWRISRSRSVRKSDALPVSGLATTLRSRAATAGPK